MDWGSVFNSVVDFTIWFVGCLHVVGCLGGLAFFFWAVYLGLKKSLKPDEENRCESCIDRTSCPAAFTGVLYPCFYFEPEVVQHDK